MNSKAGRWPLPVLIGGWIFLTITMLGLLAGTLNLLNPAAVHIPFGPNGESAEGLDGVIASTASSAVLGLVIGLPAMALSWLVVSRGGKPTDGNTRQTAQVDGKCTKGSM